METEDNKKTVFLVSPFGHTKTIRGLPVSIKISVFRTKVELETGFPSGTFLLRYGKAVLPETDSLLFSNEIKENSVLRIDAKPQVEGVVSALAKHDAGELRTRVETEGGTNTGFAFVAAFLASFLGRRDMLAQLLSWDSKILSAQTVNGRTLAHIAAANDQSGVLQMLLTASLAHNATLLGTDRSGVTPLDIARHRRAVACERVIRDFVSQSRSALLNDSAVFEETDIKSDTKTAKKDKRIKSASASFGRMKSFTSINSSRASQLVSETASSGYYTQDDASERASPDRPHPPASFTNEHTQRMSSPKRVTFNKRIKSAPVTQSKTQPIKINDDRPAHTSCYTGKPVLVYRNVPEDELRPLAVEFVEMPRKNVVGMDQKSRERHVQDLLHEQSLVSTPRSSVSGSTQDLSQVGQDSFQVIFNSESRVSPGRDQSHRSAWRPSRCVSKDEENWQKLAEKQDLTRRYTNPATSTKRAQSAKYYKASFHKRTEQELLHETIPPPRPKTANSRYRSWKPWLLEKYQQDMLKDAERSHPHFVEKQRQNVVAVKRWAKQKRKESEMAAGSEESGSSEDEEGRVRSASQKTAWARAYYQAFQNNEDFTFDKWLQAKARMFQDLDRKTLLHRRGESDEMPKERLERRVTIYEIGCTQDIPMKLDGPDTYIHAFHKWKRRKEKFDKWEKSHEGEKGKMEFSAQELLAMRSALYLDGFGYGEWLGQIDREKHKASSKAVKFRLE